MLPAQQQDIFRLLFGAFIGSVETSTIVTLKISVSGAASQPGELVVAGYGPITKTPEYAALPDVCGLTFDQVFLPKNSTVTFTLAVRSKKNYVQGELFPLLAQIVGGAAGGPTGAYIIKLTNETGPNAPIQVATTALNKVFGNDIKVIKAKTLQAGSRELDFSGPSEGGTGTLFRIVEVSSDKLADIKFAPGSTSARAALRAAFGFEFTSELGKAGGLLNLTDSSKQQSVDDVCRASASFATDLPYATFDMARALMETVRSYGLKGMGLDLRHCFDRFDIDELSAVYPVQAVELQGWMDEWRAAAAAKAAAAKPVS